MNRTVATVAVLWIAGAGAAYAQSSTGAPAAGGNPPALTEGHARSLMMGYGCTNLSHLSRGMSGSWHGQCSKGGQTIDVMVDPEGKVSTGRAEHITAANARAVLMNYGCSNVSTLSPGPQGTWHGQCTKGGQTVNVMVDQEGKASQAAAQHITEAHARSALMDYGCANVSSLSPGANGTWSGQCQKGGKTMDVTVDQQGKAGTR